MWKPREIKEQFSVVKCHLGPSVLPSKKTISPLTSKKPEVHTPLGSPLISLLCPRAARIQIVTLSVFQPKVFGLSASSCCPSAAVCCSYLLEQDQKSVVYGMLSWSPLTTSRSAPVPGTPFCSCTSGRLFRRPRRREP